ncbi:MAG: cupin domain-containing protein [Dehalococcoidales bacterium]|nr:cupin domain-containing protein [Dehalococcoidales bacterium]
MFIHYKDAKITCPFKGITRRMLAHDPALMLTEHTLEKGAVLPDHSHPHVQLVFLRSGRLMIEMAGEKLEVVEGDSLAIPSGIPHKVTALEESSALDMFSPAREDYM